MSAAPDPMVPLYARWKAARTEWRILADVHPNWDVPPMPDLSDRQNDLIREIARTQPTTPLGLALQLRAIWEDFGPVSIPGTEAFAEEAEELEHRIILTALNAAEHLAGLPVTLPPYFRVVL